MRYFPLLDFQYVVLLVFLGLAVLLLLYSAFGAYGSDRRKEEVVEDLEEYPGDIEVGNRSIPPVLIFVYIAFVVWAVAYLIVVGIGGGPF